MLKVDDVIATFERGDAVYADLKDNIKLTAYITEASVPDQLSETILWTYNIGNKLAEESIGKVVFDVIDPDNLLPKNNSPGRLDCFVTDETTSFPVIAERFLGHPVSNLYYTDISQN